jgi:hypothetical protein
MRLDLALKKSRPWYISAQKISTLFDALDEREIALFLLHTKTDDAILLTTKVAR